MSSSSRPNTITMRGLLDDENDDSHFFNNKNSYDFNSKIMLGSIIALSVVVVLVIILHTYARCVLKRQALRRAAALRRQGSTVTHVHSVMVEPPKRGLEPSVIAALPVFLYKHVQKGGQGDTHELECAVCLSMLEDEEMTRLLPNCNHTFHANCIDTWLTSQTTCPICRTEAEPARPGLVLHPEPREGPAASSSEPTAPPLERVLSCTAAGTSGDGRRVNTGSISRLSSSFRKILTRDRSSRRAQSCGQEDGFEDLERQ